MHPAAPPPGYCLEPGEELREYMRRSMVLARGSSRPPRGAEVVAVGDYTLASLLEEGVEPRAAIVDCATRRVETRCPEPPPGYRVVRVYNPRGYISWQAWCAVSLVLRRRGYLVIVEGEEDLLAIPAILEAEAGTVIAYGIPWAGLNTVEAAEAKPLAEYIARSSRTVPCPASSRHGKYYEMLHGYSLYPGLEANNPPLF